MKAFPLLLSFVVVAFSKVALPPGPKPESPSEKAARHWQAGVFALQRGDYGWAKRQFDECLKAEPANEACKKGAADAADAAAMQPAPAKKAGKAAKRKKAHKR